LPTLIQVRKTLFQASFPDNVTSGGFTKKNTSCQQNSTQRGRGFVNIADLIFAKALVRNVSITINNEPSVYFLNNTIVSLCASIEKSPGG
jgi:hypothetical protein